ncbi:hypothetical protein [Thalassospira sp. TSL5-1]|uniref:hypothetical protein n=1 Tax=Thalassospira sp. TSL5-1 TaxID=1544451 RepID=UPI00093B1123|nr:hypothetical protein [Thalassospira sp. TSL5-1]OKH87523.1 hypothetical protein LF95_12100 [Thalassospira sp. TSL5-1]
MTVGNDMPGYARCVFAAFDDAREFALQFCLYGNLNGICAVDRALLGRNVAQSPDLIVTMRRVCKQNQKFGWGRLLFVVAEKLFWEGVAINFGKGAFPQ